MLVKSRIIYLFLLLITFTARAQDFSGVISLVERVTPWLKDKVIIRPVSLPAGPGKEVFRLQTINGKLLIQASSISAASTAYNYYLNNYCHQSISHCGDNLFTLKTLPPVNKVISVSSSFQYRYALNYCTYNYSMSFWKWKQWEKELDWMALNGVNLMLAVNGTEIVWQKILQDFGFTDAEIKAFIPGPAFTAWWLMGNLEGWGGPVTNTLIQQQYQLQKKILARMKVLGIEPVLQGFYGMVPVALQQKYPKAAISNQGKWVSGFQRPSILLPQDSLFKKMAASYYGHLKALYGDCKFLGGDPFHEGGTTEGINVAQSAAIIQQTMIRHFPQSTWVLQGWMGNPKDELLKGLQKDKVLVLGLRGEDENSWEKRDAYGHSKWVWCSITNFGERVGFAGKLQRLVTEPHRALQTPQGKYLQGLGIIPEGIINNPLLYDLCLKTAWEDQPNLDSMLYRYMLYRYGLADKDLYKVMQLLNETVYHDHGQFQDGPTESVFCARPDTVIKSTSSWGNRKIYYDEKKLEQALLLMQACAPKLKDKETFRFDITDMARQVIANKGQHLYDSCMAAFKRSDTGSYRQYKSRFLQLLQQQDELLSTNTYFMLGPVLQQARDLGVTAAEKQLYQYNEKMQITIWGLDTIPTTELHEYAHKEWAGILKQFYLPRWQLFFHYLDDAIAGKAATKPDYFSFERNWIQQHQQYSTQPAGDYLSIIHTITNQLSNTEKSD